jgi:hypothetical protein
VAIIVAIPVARDLRRRIRAAHTELRRRRDAAAAERARLAALRADLNPHELEQQRAALKWRDQRRASLLGLPHGR